MRKVKVNSLMSISFSTCFKHIERVATDFCLQIIFDFQFSLLYYIILNINILIIDVEIGWTRNPPKFVDFIMDSKF